MTNALTTLSGAPLSEMMFGTMQFGGTADADEAKAMYAASRAVGINAFDTAYAYNGGASERMLAPLIENERDQIYVATKNNFPAGAGGDVLRASLDESLARLGLDQVDMFYLHRWDDDTPLEETFETMAELQTQGLYRHIGVSNYAAWQVMKAQAVAAKFGTKIDAFQPMYNLVKRQAEVEILPMAADQGIAIFPYSPLGGGLLTGKYATEGAEGRLITDKMYAARYAQDWMHGVAQELTAMAGDLGVSPITLAVAWAGHHPDVTAPIISARSLAQLQPSLDAATFEMTDALYDQITALSRTPAPATDRLEEA